MNFTYYSPTKIFFGVNEEEKIGTIIKQYGFKKILLHYGTGSIKKNGLYKKVIDSLDEARINYVELGGVEPNPDIELVRTGVDLCKKEHVDFILAVGGGSVIDSAKSIAASVLVDIDPLDLTLHLREATKVLPIGVILTISAAGSELSNSCVISDRKTLLKNGFNSDLIRPLFVIENPRLTYTVSKYQTACGVVDILMHTLERYLTDVDCNQLADTFALGLMKDVIKAGKVVIVDPTNYEARATLMLASSFSHNGLTGMGGKMYFTVHKLEHQLSGKYDTIAHGAGLAVLFPAWAKYVYKHLKTKFLNLAYEIWNIDQRLPEDYAVELCIEKFKNYFKFLEMPTSLSEFGFDIDIERMANDITKNGTIKVPGFIELNKNDVIKIFEISK